MIVSARAVGAPDARRSEPMGEHGSTVTWERRGAVFSDNRYSRAHQWRFDGGAVVPASASPHVVPEPLSDPAGVDPEEALVAALSSCHMLTFLWLAAKRGFVVDSYADDAVGRMGVNAAGRESVAHVALRPRVRFCGERAPTDEEMLELHHAAHEQCFIANSVTTEVVVEPVANG
jgi:organic hydroperoxide reductase OsmC/OhrA